MGNSTIHFIYIAVWLVKYRPEEPIRLDHQFGNIVVELRYACSIDKLSKCRVILSSKNYPVLTFTLLVRILEVIIINLFRCWTVLVSRPTGFSYVVTKSYQQQRQRSDSLLTVDHEPSLKGRATRLISLNVDN